MRQTTGQLGRSFESYAERYRAQAEQSPHGPELSPDEVRGIEEDLKMLEASVMM